jgi:hypothetical protein
MNASKHSRQLLTEKYLEIAQLNESSAQDVINAVTRRIVNYHVELITKHGLDEVTNAIEDFASGMEEEDLEEIGTSDVSYWVSCVIKMLESQKTHSNPVRTEAKGMKNPNDGKEYEYYNDSYEYEGVSYNVYANFDKEQKPTDFKPSKDSERGYGGSDVYSSVATGFSDLVVYKYDTNTDKETQVLDPMLLDTIGKDVLELYNNNSDNGGERSMGPDVRG